MSDALSQIHSWFKANGKTLCCAESLTSGGLQAAIGSRSGASKFFRGGVTAYDIQVKAQLLGVDTQHAQQVNAVSPIVARQMAAGACDLFQSDIGLATTGYAEAYPDAGAEQPYAFYAIIRRRDATPLAEGRVDGAGLDRAAMQQHVTQTVLEKLASLLPTL